MQPEGTYGPAFLTPKNYYVIKDYNFSDLYVLFVGHLSDRIAGGRAFETPWSKNAQLKTREVESMQQRLTALGLYKDKIDGKAGHAHPRGARRLSEGERPEGRLLADRGGARPHAACGSVNYSQISTGVSGSQAVPTCGVHVFATVRRGA